MSRVREAFDRHASVYDDVFSSTQIRSEVWTIADRYFAPGTRLLDLGCGTGEDAIHFAERGVNVTAIDISPAMTGRLKSKSNGAIHCETADMRIYAPLNTHFDGVFSNFGALNCVADLDWLRRLPIKPGSHLVFTTMGRFYPLESAVFLLKGNLRAAFRRFGQSPEATVAGVRFNVYYHGLGQIQKALGSEFRLQDVKGLCSLRSSPGLGHLERYKILRFLDPIDRWLCSHRTTAALSDHFVSVWQYRET